MARRLILCGLGLAAFVVTLAFSSWGENLWRSEAPAAAQALPGPGYAPTATQVPARPPQFAPVIATADPPVALPTSDASRPPEDVEMGRRDRGSGRGSRNH